MRKLFLITTLILTLGLNVASSQQDLPLDTIQLPDNFNIELFATGIPRARMMTLSDQGTLFIGTRGSAVYAIPDATSESLGLKQPIVLITGLNTPGGVAFYEGALYVGTADNILRYDDIENNLYSPPTPVVINTSVPTAHGAVTIRFGPDGKLYKKVGAPCNVCENTGYYATITRMNPDGSDVEVYATGIRNAVGFDWHPDTDELWFTNNGRDHLGDDLPPDTLHHAPTIGLNFGFPYCHAGYISDPQFGHLYACDEFDGIAYPLGPHVAPLGMHFYDGTMFPDMYQKQIFIAEHGSWNRSVPIGYRITLVTLENSDPTGYEVFAEGWLQSNGEPWGRPVDIQVMPDGSMLVSDDYIGVIYRIQHCAAPNGSTQFTENELSHYIEETIATNSDGNIDQVLVDFDHCSMELTVITKDGTGSLVEITLDSLSHGYAALQIGDIVTTNTTYRHTINTELLPLLIQSMDMMFEGNNEVDTLTISDDKLAVTFVSP